MVGNLTQNTAKLKRIFVEPKLPEGLAQLMEISQNLWWSWNHDAIDLFKSIDAALFEKHNFNPIALLDDISIEKAHDLLKSSDFMAHMKRVHKAFKTYMEPAKSKTGPRIGYFCMEYGLHQSVRL